jgi:hypothetical protein
VWWDPSFTELRDFLLGRAANQFRKCHRCSFIVEHRPHERVRGLISLPRYPRQSEVDPRCKLTRQASHFTMQRSEIVLVDLRSTIHLVGNGLRIHICPNLPCAPAQCICQSFDQGAILGNIIFRWTYSRKSIDNVLFAIPDRAEYNTPGLAAEGAEIS